MLLICICFFSIRFNTLQLGIRDIFDDTATLTGIAKTKRDSRHLIVSDVLQKTGIEVNENGTTAYAVTGKFIVNEYHCYHTGSI